MPESAPLLGLTEELRAALESLRVLPGLPAAPGAVDGDLRRDILLTLDAKVLPELRASEHLPIFIGIQGGANTGKSTVFNALAGKILSPSVIQASATKHPLVFVHERWRPRFLDDCVLPAFACRELGDPRDLLLDAARTEILYLRFHEDDGLGDLALIDSPDFDSVLETNLEVARGITALADVTLFVTTAQKYRDRELVARLRRLAALKSRVLLVFNMVDEEIVFRTLVDDLEEVLPLRENDIRAVRLPRSSAPHPEEELGALLKESVLEELRSLDPAAVKPGIVRRALRHVLDAVGQLQASFGPELRFKERLLVKAGEALEQEVEAYGKSFALAFPEETLAMRRLIEMTRFGPWLQLPQGALELSGSHRLVAVTLRRLHDGTRDLLVRLTRRSEDTVEDRPGMLEEYARTRNETDLQNVLRAAENLRLQIEAYCRGAADSSALARELLGGFFTSARAERFRDDVGASFEKAVADRRAGSEDIVERIEGWRERHRYAVTAIRVGALVVKLAVAWLIAWVVPPDGMFSIFNWVYFAVGYVLAAYVIALVLSFFARRKGRFRKRRIEGARTVLAEVLAAPLEQAAGELLSPAQLDPLERARARLAGHPELAGEDAPPA